MSDPITPERIAAIRGLVDGSGSDLTYGADALDDAVEDLLQAIGERDASLSEVTRERDEAIHAAVAEADALNELMHRLLGDLPEYQPGPPSKPRLSLAIRRVVELREGLARAKETIALNESWRARFEKVRAHRRIYVDEYLSSPFRRGRCGFARVWLVGADFGYGYVSYESLASTSMCSDSIGEMPEWLDQVVSDDGWGCVLGSHCDEHASFLIEHGIAPGQPFRVEVTMDVSRSGWEYVEYDVEFEAVVIEVARWSPDRVRAAWERWARIYLAPGTEA